MLDINTNLEELFHTQTFYKIIANEGGRELQVGTLKDPKTIFRNETLETAITHAIEHRERTESHAPILLYPCFYGPSDMPMYAVTETRGVLEFARGYCIAKTRDFVAIEIFMKYLHQKENPEIIQHARTEELNESFDAMHTENFKALFGSKGCYTVYGTGLRKYENCHPQKGKVYAKTFTGNMQYSFLWILQDKKKDGNNYPIIVLNDDKTPQYVIDSANEEIKTFYEGYYARVPFSGTCSIDNAIEMLYDEEMTKRLKKTRVIIP